MISMWWCERHGLTEDVYARTDEELHSEVDTRQHEIITYMACRECGDEVEPAGICPICGNPMDPKLSRCIDCERVIESAYDKARNMAISYIKSNVDKVIDWTIAEDALDEWLSER